MPSSLFLCKVGLKPHEGYVYHKNQFLSVKRVSYKQGLAEDDLEFLTLLDYSVPSTPSCRSCRGLNLALCPCYTGTLPTELYSHPPPPPSVFKIQTTWWQMSTIRPFMGSGGRRNRIQGHPWNIVSSKPA